MESIDLLPYVGYAIPTISIYANGYVDISLFKVAFFQARQLVRCSESRQVIPLLGVKRFVDFVDQLLRGRPVITDSIQQLLRGCPIMRPAFDQFDWLQPEQSAPHWHAAYSRAAPRMLTESRVSSGSS